MPSSSSYPSAYGQTAAAYGQGYPAGAGPPYFGGVECSSYLAPVHAHQLSPMGGAVSGHHHLSTPPGHAHSHAHPPHQAYPPPLTFNADCLDYKDTPSWRFQVL